MRVREKAARDGELRQRRVGTGEREDELFGKDQRRGQRGLNEREIAGRSLDDSSGIGRLKIFWIQRRTPGP
jgi:hypothetical protein